MPPRPKKRTAEAPAASSTLLAALRFVALVTKDTGPIHDTHIHLGANWATAFNGVIAAGCPITEDIYASPNAKLIVEALSKCGEHISFTQLSNSLSIKSDKFKAIVPCIDPMLLNVALPDKPICAIDDRFKEGLSIVGTLANENAQSVHLASILMNGQSLIATNGKVVIEYWCGTNMPTISLPKALVEPLTKTSKKLIEFGLGQSSITFYFDDNSWIKSQLYSEKWPDINNVLNMVCNPWPIAGDFFKGVAAIEPFGEGFVYTRDGSLHSHAEPGAGASFECPGIPGGLTLVASQMALIKPWAERIDFLAIGPNKMHCIKAFGGNIRCAIAGIR